MMRLITNILEKFFILISLLFLSGAFLPLWRQLSGFDLNFIEGDPLQQAIFAVIYAVSFFLLFLRPHWTLNTMRAGVYLWPLLCWALLSVLWSAAPEVTMRRIIALMGTTMFGVYIASRFEHREFLRLLGWTLLVMVVLSYIFIFLIPNWGIMQETRGLEWRGIYLHKNGLGRMVALAVVVFLQLAKSEPRKRSLWWLSLILAIGLIVGSHSVTALVVLLILFFLLPAIKILKLRYELAVSLFFMFIMLMGVLTYFISANVGELLSILGRNITLTGRTYLWKAAIYMVRQHPWLGYGYGAFWLGWDGPSAEIWQITSIYATSADNSFLDILLTLGFIGIVLFALSYITALKQALKSMKKDGEWSIIYLIFMLLYSVSESSILHQNNILWVIYVAVVLGVEQRNYYNIKVKTEQKGVLSRWPSYNDI